MIHTCNISIHLFTEVNVVMVFVKHVVCHLDQHTNVVKVFVGVGVKEGDASKPVDVW